MSRAAWAVTAATSGLPLLLGLCVGACGYRSTHGPPPATPPRVESASCDARAPATPGCEHRDPEARPVRFLPATRGGQWWVASRARGYQCRMPCTLQVARYSRLDVIEVDGRGETIFERPLPLLPDTADGTALVAQPQPGRGSVWLGASAVAVGELAFFGGVGGFFSQSGGCSGDWSTSGAGCTLAKVGLIGGPAVAALGGAYWLFYYRGDDVKVGFVREF